MKIIKEHAISLRYALEGLYWAFKTQKNFRLEVIIAIFAIGLGFLLSFTPFEIAVSVLTVLIVLTCELINTCLEETLDLIEEKWHYQVKIIKDISAGMVFISVIASITIFFLLYIPRLLIFFSI